MGFLGLRSAPEQNAPPLRPQGYHPNLTYIPASGTTFSSAYGAAAGALCLSVNPSLAPADVESILEATCVDLGPVGFDTTYSHGYLNAYGIAWQAALTLPDPAEKLFLTCGTYEGNIYYNRSMVPLFESTGMDVRYVEARDGHNWESWRDQLRGGLSWLFPGPLWMIYE